MGFLKLLLPGSPRGQSKAQADLRGLAVPNHGHEANIAIKRVKGIFWFPSAHKSYVYTTL